MSLNCMSIEIKAPFSFKKLNCNLKYQLQLMKHQLPYIPWKDTVSQNWWFTFLMICGNTFIKQLVKRSTI